MEEDEPDFELLENPARVLPAQVCAVTFVSSFFFFFFLVSSCEFKKWTKLEIFWSFRLLDKEL